MRRYGEEAAENGDLRRKMAQFAHVVGQIEPLFQFQIENGKFYW
jgi:hypothetical protein